MWTTIATFKENLSQIASDVQDTADELEIGGGSERRPPEGSADRKPLLANGIDSNVKAELEWYKGEIQRLQNAEAEIQAMSINYASLLKEREEELSRLHDENGKLKKAMEGSTTGYMLVNGDDRKSMEVSDISKVGDNSLNGPEVLQGHMDVPAIRQQRYTNAPRNQRVHGKHANTGTIVTSNGSTPPLELEGRQQLMELKIKKLQEREKELTNLLRDETQALVALKGDHEKSLAEIKKLKELREIDQADLANVKLQLQKEQDLHEVAQNECTVLKAEKQRMSMEIAELQKNLNDRNAEMNKLQEELSKRKLTHSNEYVEKLKNTVATLEKEKIELQTEKDGLINHLKSHQKQVLEREYGDGSGPMSDMKLIDDKQLQPFPENLGVAEETYRLQILELEQSLKNVSNERDKAVRNLARLKQHLLEKECEDSEKMDHDSARITELQAQLDARNDRVLQLEKFLAHAIANQEVIKKSNIDELQKANEVISDLRQKLAGCVSALESKNVELQNLQTVLGQYYAESEAKDRVFGELASAREEIIKLSEGLKDTTHSTGSSTKSKGIAKTSNTCESTQTSVEAGVYLNKQEKVTGKPLFNLFVEFVKPLQTDLEKCEGFIDLQESKKFHHMSHAQSTVVAINGLLGVVKDDRIYIPTEDTPGQAHFNYLKRIYNTIFQLGALVPTLCTRVAAGVDNRVRNELVKRFGNKEQVFGPGLETLAIRIMKEIVLALGYLLEIEYRVVEEELLGSWLLLLSFLALDSCGNNPILAPELIKLGCRIIHIYGELRQAANHGIELKNKEKEEILDKLALAERRLSESQQTAGKFEEEILRLRRALEQSMTRLNRMSLDSDYLVDRRIVIKLLVTYFQRQHSKEVLDLMVRMLGFTEEDKQRIGLAQHVASKGVVRGVLGLPGRLVGGILGSGSSEVSPPVPSENQSFSDLWIDFLLKESQERERRENAEEQAKAGISRQDRELTSTDSRGVTASEARTSTIRGDASLKYPIGAQETVHSTDRFSNFPVTYSFMEQNPRTHISREGRWANPVDTEFSTVPLTSASNNQHSRVMPKP